MLVIVAFILNRLPSRQHIELGIPRELKPDSDFKLRDRSPASNFPHGDPLPISLFPIPPPPHVPSSLLQANIKILLPTVGTRTPHENILPNQYLSEKKIDELHSPKVQQEYPGDAARPSSRTHRKIRGACIDSYVV